MTAVWRCAMLCGAVCVHVCRLLRSGLKRSNSDPGNVARSKRQLGEQGMGAMHCSVCVSVCPCVSVSVCVTLSVHVCVCVCAEPEPDSSRMLHMSAADTLRHTKKLKSELECEHRLSDK